jgi:hypothetical protein
MARFKYKVSYWPKDDFTCDDKSRAISHPDMKHVHCKTDQEAAKAFLDHTINFHCHSDVCIKPTTCLYHNDKRYWCITGPGGLVRGIDYEEI